MARHPHLYRRIGKLRNRALVLARGGHYQGWPGPTVTRHIRAGWILLAISAGYHIGVAGIGGAGRGPFGPAGRRGAWRIEIDMLEYIW